MDLTDEDFRRGVITIGKQSLEKTAAEKEPFLPKMLVEVDGDLIVMNYPASFEGLTAVAEFLIDHGHPVTGICLTVDTYHLIAPKGEDIEDIERYAGRLEAEFLNGNKMVVEALHLTLVTEAQVVAVSIPYVRHGTLIEWREEIVIDSAMSEQQIKGRFPELLQSIITATNMEAS